MSTTVAPVEASDPWFQDLFATRIGGARYGKDTAIYKFEKIKRAKRQAVADHPERRMLDFGIGENDEMAPEHVRAVMRREVDRPENRGYADNGIAAYKEAAAAFMAREFGVRLDPVTEVNHCIGSKTAYAMLPAAFIDPGDVTLMTVPGYPVAGTATQVSPAAAAAAGPWRMPTTPIHASRAPAVRTGTARRATGREYVARVSVV